MFQYSQLPEKLIGYIEEWKYKKGSLIMILRAAQGEYGYVPHDVCLVLSDVLNVPLARIYEVLTFYNYFKFKKSAKYKISVCMGTACYLNGAHGLIEAITEYLGINEKEITQDGLFELEFVRCMGCCALAPAININGKIHSRLNKASVLKVLEGYKNRG